MAYDSLNRLLSKVYTGGTSATPPVPATPSVTYTYDTDLPISDHNETNYPKGRLTQVSSSASTTAYRYEALGRVQSSAQTTNGQPYVFGYGYAPVGLKSETYPTTKRVVNYAYDGGGRVGSVTGVLGTSTVYAGGMTQATLIGYAPQGGIQQMMLGNGIVEVTAYNSRLQPASIAAGSLLTLSYGYGETTPNGPVAGSDNGNVLTQTITRWNTANAANQTWTQSYSYDGVNRLLSASETGPGTAWTQGFGYDIAGNRWVNAANPGPVTVTNETPQSSAWYASARAQNGACWVNPNQIAASGWCYDAAGNIVNVGGTANSGTGDRRFAYDAENRQTCAMVNAAAASTCGSITGGVETYKYDGDGQRVMKVNSDGTTVYVYDAMGNLASEYPALAPTTGGAEYLTADVLGTTRLVTDATGVAATIICLDYLPFGEQITSGVDGRGGACFGLADPVMEKKFTGKERDAESGLDYFGARYLSAAQGRFTTPDWLAKPQPVPYADLRDPQTLNLYAYVRNNPLSRIDPDGHYECGGSKEQCETVRAGLNAVRAADAGLKNGTSGKALLDRVLGFYGDEGKKNGVKIDFTNANPRALGATSTKDGVTTISFGAHALDPFGAAGKGETVAHEGAHGVDQLKQGMPVRFWQFYDTEYHAYQGESAVDKGLGVRSESDGDRPVWAPGMTPLQRSLSITRSAYSNAQVDCDGGGCQ